MSLFTKRGRRVGVLEGRWHYPSCPHLHQRQLHIVCFISCQSSPVILFINLFRPYWPRSSSILPLLWWRRPDQPVATNMDVSKLAVDAVWIVLCDASRFPTQFVNRSLSFIFICAPGYPNSFPIVNIHCSCQMSCSLCSICWFMHCCGNAFVSKGSSFLWTLMVKSNDLISATFHQSEEQFSILLQKRHHHHTCLRALFTRQNLLSRFNLPEL